MRQLLFIVVFFISLALLTSSVLADIAPMKISVPSSARKANKKSIRKALVKQIRKQPIRVSESSAPELPARQVVAALPEHSSVSLSETQPRCRETSIQELVVRQFHQTAGKTKDVFSKYVTKIRCLTKTALHKGKSASDAITRQINEIKK
ncbi:MAG: hypothetical protein ACOYL3_23760 [Desulfuromonadaceae bacterium]